MKQIDFWPEEIKIRDVGRIDLSTIENINRSKSILQPRSLWSFSDFKKDDWYLYPTGGKNRYMLEEGSTFPYLYNNRTTNIQSPSYRTPGNTKGNYPCYTLTKGSTNPFNKTINFSIHILVARAFIINDFPNIRHYVDHINRDPRDYRIKNLRWASPSENQRNRWKNK